MSGISSDDALRIIAQLLIGDDGLEEIELGSLMYGASVAPETLEIWVNGMLQTSGTGYVAKESVVVFLDPLLAGDTLRASAVPSLNLEA